MNPRVTNTSPPVPTMLKSKINKDLRTYTTSIHHSCSSAPSIGQTQIVNNSPPISENHNINPMITDFTNAILYQLKDRHLRENTDEAGLIVLQGSINHQKINILIDSGAMPSFINSKLSILKTVPSSDTPVKIRLADKSTIPGRLFQDIPFQASSGSAILAQTHSFIAAPIAYDIILGKDWLNRYNPSIDWPTNTISMKHLSTEVILQGTPPKPSIEHISANSLKRILRKEKDSDCRCGIVFSRLLQERKDTLNLTEAENKTLKTTQDKEDADKKALSEMPAEIQELAHRYPAVFAPFEGVPPSRPYDHKIELIDPSAKPPSRPIYPMSEQELSALKEELDFLTKNGRIQHSASPYGAPIFYVAQKGKLRLVFDYRALNKNTVKNVTGLPNIQEILDRLSKARYFSKLDLSNGYHQVRIAPQDIHKTAFRTKYGSFEWVVMPFGLTNAPATFQSLVNNVFHDFIDEFLCVYIDDILIFSETEADHQRHLEQVLQRMQDHHLHARLAKCEFWKQELEYLGYHISSSGVSVLPSRTQAIADFEPPTSWTELRSFLGLANTIHRFVQRHADVVAPLSDLLKGAKVQKNQMKPFEWNSEAQVHFEAAKTALTSPAMLAMFDPAKPVHLYTDWSEKAIGSYICQPDSSGIEHPVAYASRKCNPAESKYHPYMGEILALVEALRTHRHYLMGPSVRVFTDHRSLEHILDQPKLRPVQHRWLADILTYDFQIQWTPGNWNTVADAISRRSYRKDAATSTLNAMDAYYTVSHDLLADIKAQCQRDEEYLEISKFLVDTDDPAFQNEEPEAAEVPASLRTKLKRYRLRNKLLYYLDKERARLFVPKVLRQLIISMAHDDGPAIHNNWERTSSRIARHYHWPHLHKDVYRYVQRCDPCQRNKIARHAPYGLLEPHEVPQCRWETISWDFTGPLPVSRSGNNMIFTIVDSATKRVILVPCKQTDTARHVADYFLQHVWRHHGLPRTIISDRASIFMDQFWKHLLKSLRVTQNVSTSYHPQTDGQSEVKNDFIKTALRHFVNFYQDDWEKYLFLVEHGINDTVNSSTGYTPFQLDTGRHPISLLDINMRGHDQFEAKELQDVYRIVRDKIRTAQDKSAAYANQRRLADPFQVGDLVLLSNKHFQPPELRDQPYRKLSPKYSGPYKIIEKVGISYKLDLPQNWSVHPVFHPEKLKPYFWDTTGPHPLSSLPLAQRRIERILAVRVLPETRVFSRQSQALVKWVGHSPVYNVWLNYDDELRSIIQRDLPHLQEDWHTQTVLELSARPEEFPLTFIAASLRS